MDASRKRDREVEGQGSHRSGKTNWGASWPRDKIKGKQPRLRLGKVGFKACRRGKELSSSKGVSFGQQWARVGQGENNQGRAKRAEIHWTEPTPPFS